MARQQGKGCAGDLRRGDVHVYGLEAALGGHVHVAVQDRRHDALRAACRTNDASCLASESQTRHASPRRAAPQPHTPAALFRSALRQPPSRVSFVSTRRRPIASVAGKGQRGGWLKRCRHGHAAPPTVGSSIPCPSRAEAVADTSNLN